MKRNDGVTEKVVFAFPFPALAEINHFAESSSLEIRFKDGAHRTSSERVQLERLEEVRCPITASPCASDLVLSIIQAVFFLHNYMLAYAQAQRYLERLE